MIQKENMPVLPEGFRHVEPGEVIPAGYTTQVSMDGSGRQITNAPATTSPASPTPPKKTEMLDVQELQQEDKGMLEVDWGSGNGKDDLLGGSKKPVPQTTASTVISLQPNSPKQEEKFKFGIQVLVMVLDFILSNVLAKIAGEGEKPTVYTADKEGRENFEQSLCLLLDTKRDFIPTWLIVLLAFASAWGFQIMAAIQTRAKKGKPVSERKESAEDSLKPGLFIGTDGKPYRRYANGSVRPAQFDQFGNEKIVGAPTRKRAA